MWKFWDYLKSKNFHFYGGIGIVTLFAASAFKQTIYDRFVPISEVQKMIPEGKFGSMVLGNFMMLCYFKSP